MRLQFLGSGDAFGSGGRFNTCFHLERRRHGHVLIDCGASSMVAIRKWGVDPNGISEASQALLADAVKQGVKVHSANLMVMYFGKEFINKGKSEGQLGVDSANTAYAQLQKIDPAIQVGLCPCLGRNGSSAEVFGLADATTLKAFADQTPWVCSLHYWSINDDVPKVRKHRADTGGTNATGVVSYHEKRPSEAGPQPWTFVKVFQPFTSQ